MNTNTKNKKNKYLTRDDKAYIEGYLSKAIGNSIRLVNSTDKKYLIKRKKLMCKIYKELANDLSKSIRTIIREINRGLYIKRNALYEEVYAYSYDISNNKRELAKTNKQTKLKIDKNHRLYQYIAKMLKSKYSPYVCLEKAKMSGYEPNFGLKTLYNYLNSGLFESVGITIDKLPYKRHKSMGKVSYKPIKLNTGVSIENRSDEINSRETFGHWEIDCVVGKREGKSTSLLVLTERLTRYEIIRKIDKKTARNVELSLDEIVSSNKYIIKTITSDNGSEFIGIKDTSRYADNWFYCHPFCSGERGSNENNNKLIRRHIPKGMSMKNISENKVRKIERFINNYKRKIFNGKSSKEVYLEQMKIERKA